MTNFVTNFLSKWQISFLFRKYAFFQKPFIYGQNERKAYVCRLSLELPAVGLEPDANEPYGLIL